MIRFYREKRNRGESLTDETGNQKLEIGTNNERNL
jgi:hypothetical protein